MTQEPGAQENCDSDTIGKRNPTNPPPLEIEGADGSECTTRRVGLLVGAAAAVGSHAWRAKGGRKERLGRSGGLCAHWLLDGQRSGAEPCTR
jgi:hypothetical protein